MPHSSKTFSLQDIHKLSSTHEPAGKLQINEEESEGNKNIAQTNSTQIE